MQYPDSLFKINEFPLKNASDFKYLGGTSQVDDSSVGQIEIENRITSGTCKFYELKSFFTNRKIKLSTRVQFLNSLVRTRITYLCQTWTATKSQIGQIQSTIVQFLRSMIKGGHQRLKPESYTRNNGTTGEFAKYRFSKEEILKISQNEPVADYILRQQTNWIAHCINAEDSDFIKTLTFPDYPKGNLKSGIMPTTYRDVLQSFKAKKKTENDMITELKRNTTCAVQRAATTIDEITPDSNGSNMFETVENL